MHLPAAALVVVLLALGSGTTDLREVAAGDSKGEVETRWNAMEQYLHRLSIFDASAAAEDAKRKNALTVKAARDQAERRQEERASMTGMNFLQFYQYYSVRATPRPPPPTHHTPQP